MNFFTYIRDELLFPWLLRGGAVIIALVRMIAGFLDSAADDAVYIMRQFLVATCGEQFLDAAGLSRRLLRRTGESDAAYRLRLLKAYAHHRLGGKRAGYELAVNTASPTVAVRVFVPGENAWVLGRDAIGSAVVGPGMVTFEVMLIYPRATTQPVKDAVLEAAKSVKGARDYVYNQIEYIPPDLGYSPLVVGQTAIGSSYIN